MSLSISSTLWLRPRRHRTRQHTGLIVQLERRSALSTTSPSIRSAVSPLPDIIGLGGAVAGLGGGLAMALVGAIISASLDGDVWLEAKQIATVVYGPAVATVP